MIVEKGQNIEAYKKILARFVANNFEALRKLVQFQQYYHECLILNEAANSRDKQEEEEEEEDLYFERLENGLFTLQMINLILAQLYTQSSVRQVLFSISNSFLMI